MTEGVDEVCARRDREDRMEGKIEERGTQNLCPRGRQAIAAKLDWKLLKKKSSFLFYFYRLVFFLLAIIRTVSNRAIDALKGAFLSIKMPRLKSKNINH